MDPVSLRLNSSERHNSRACLHINTILFLSQSSSLKTALLDYLKRCLPADSEKHNMVALCFSMRREIGENHEMAARTQLKIIESKAWGEHQNQPESQSTSGSSACCCFWPELVTSLWTVVDPELKSSLVKVLGLLKDAAESFSKVQDRLCTLCHGYDCKRK